MFDKFGEFDSVEELNLSAAGLLKEGDCILGTKLIGGIEEE